ncbi:histidinol dehydrogenase [Blastopirellula retiformator]|uniref:Histidinol dehydrogenase n=1 Tax=Blastopirellula retiformator TaxID=2527970 RepID=A0A5C5V1J2_9BACT|nr:histidinol dehydrogenase [Blastopirellula retiformator]TWT31637.1 Histidinol dehydrogenase [Blastopirellula retiformator]
MAEIALNIARIDARQDDVPARLAELREKLSPRGNVVSEAGRRRTIETFGEPLSPQQVVERICHEVQTEGLAAVLRYSEKLDGKQLTAETIRVPQSELEAAHAAAAPEFLETLRKIRENIWEFQTAILHKDVQVDRPDGNFLRQRYLPLQRAGLCVPGGAAAYPSTVLMTAVPALAAGVKELVVVAPPTPFGSYNTDLLATCHELGVTEVYRMGGAQAVAALAYGVEGIPQVDKIVGPGNLFVALAKKHVYGEVDIDSIAGPSEVVVIADETTRADYTAADLLAQAEHAPGASILITWSPATLEATYAELNRQVALLERCELTVQSLEAFGCLILAESQEQACQLANEIAPEHLHIATDSAETLLDKIPNAGATFLGNYTPVALGDYAAGPSHVLPTGGTARWASGLSANDFLRSSSVIHYTDAGIQAIAPHVQRMADKEGLTAHRRSVDIRVS